MCIYLVITNCARYFIDLDLQSEYNRCYSCFLVVYILIKGIDNTQMNKIQIIVSAIMEIRRNGAEIKNYQVVQSEEF